MRRSSTLILYILICEPLLVEAQPEVFSCVYGDPVGRKVLLWYEALKAFSEIGVIGLLAEAKALNVECKV